MRHFVIIFTFATLLTCDTAFAETSTTQSRTALVIGIPIMDVDLGLRGGSIAIGLYGIGLNYRTSNGFYGSIYGTRLTHIADDWGKSIDASVGYSLNLNANIEASWLANVIPQVGYRYAERWLYHRDGFGPRNVTHGMLMGASYDIYQNRDVGFYFRAHTFMEWAFYSVIDPKITYPFRDDVLTLGIDAGLSFGISFGH